jgi:hypothetical protein
MSTYRSQLADDIERHGLKGYVLNGHYLGKAQEEVIAALRATPPEERDSIPADVLRQHYLSHITCNEETLRDNPVCCCSTVNLGWHLSVGDAVEAWIQHVLDEARKATLSPQLLPTEKP